MLVQLDPIHFGDFFFFLNILEFPKSRRSSVGVAGGLPITQSRIPLSQQTLEMAQGKLIFCYLCVPHLLPVELI